MRRRRRRLSTWDIIQNDYQAQFFIRVARDFPGELDGEMRHLVWSQAAKEEEHMTGHQAIRMPRSEE
ncbi:hypothetical protein DF196_02175 [Bifidobacterium callitrichidarum]|uniref:Uncharacterized protein n=1 Tax=Bifidobacterium callitrichidarum TaxID=2052941 RepID=A0A2U2NC54_9BIFI|nr:hypothetical protein DF196_02175 [Bifidobacterium callitrichidarum]